MKDQILKAFDKWFNALPVYASSGGPARASIAGALHVLELCKERYCLDLDSYRAPGGAQIRGLTRERTRKLLEAFGEHREYLKEGGRTNRGAPGDIGKMLETLRPFEMEKMGAPERNEILCCLQTYLVERVRDWHNQQRLEVSYDPSKTTWQFISDVLASAKAKGKDGIVAQHVVGAKLALRFPDLAIQNFSYSTADSQLERPGDFFVGDTAFHVTVSPLEGVFKRCQENIHRGARAYLLVPAAKLAAARELAAETAEGRITVESIESFVSQNVEEIFEFAGQRRRGGLRTLLEKYNERVGAVELDKSLLIELPSNLSPD